MKRRFTDWMPIAFAVAAGLALATADSSKLNAQENAAGQSEAGQNELGKPGTGRLVSADPQAAQPAAPAEIIQSVTPSAAAQQVVVGSPVQAANLHDQRKAAKFYLEGVKLLEKQQPEAAWGLLRQAAALEPSNGTYVQASELARQSAVTQLVQQASREISKEVSESSVAKATQLLQHALMLDPGNESATTHLKQLAETSGLSAAGSQLGATTQSIQSMGSPLIGDSGLGGQGDIASGAIVLAPKKEKSSFHLRADSKQILRQVFEAYGIDAMMHDSVTSQAMRLDVDDATFAEAARAVGLLTNTFYEPLDPHRVVIAKDTQANRTEFERQQMETIYLPGFSDKDLTDVGTLAKTVFNAQQAVTQPSAGTLTIRAPSKTLAAFNDTMGMLEDGKSQLALNVKIIQLSHISDRETGTTFFQQTGVYNVFSEIQSVLSQNQSLVQQIISSGLVANSNTLANQIEILAILVASGQLSGTPFNQGFLPFGGGLTESILSPSPAKLTLSLNSSDTRTLEDITLRLQDDEAGTFKTGTRYPIETSSFSSAALPAALSAVLGSNTTAQTIPQIQYTDLGLTLKATPKILRSNDVALTMDIKIESLGGTSLNNIPILNSQTFTGVLTVRAGETAVLLSDLSSQQSRALNGLPGISDIPGLQDISDITRNRNVARLMILVTPTVVRDPRQSSRDKMLIVDKVAR